MHHVPQDLYWLHKGYASGTNKGSIHKGPLDFAQAKALDGPWCSIQNGSMIRLGFCFRGQLSAFQKAPRCLPPALPQSILANCDFKY